MGAIFAMQSFEGGWVYKIHPTPNVIDLNESGFRVFARQEEEFSVLGGIRWDQIEAWAELTYNGLVDAGMHPHDPQLAGDEANLAKYNEKSLEGYAIEFMEKNGGLVGFDGKLPLSILETNAPAEPTTARERENKLCYNSDEEFGLTTADCRTQVAQCVCKEGSKPNFDWSLITACIKANLRLV
ncbi:hypothetical protein BB8028_0002g01620 [Beauveria bassiana]|uniref:Uncharacterized protein n=1 Tax=Beauveria bassiana TaxID=176275 RepID=A0A2S7Y139_BEABA|nr:hypothetical protein BB8028_0002g01620 [Beauveria bassiana]